MSTLLIRNVQLDGNVTNILIEGNRFANLTAPADTVADETYDASGLALVPSFFNTHTHASMTLLRGYADDLPLFPWLNDHIWPFEGKMRAEDIYAGAKLATLEMIRSGTTWFCDMYWMAEETVRAVAESGIRATVGVTLMDHLGEAEIKRQLDFLANWKDPTNGRISLAVAPHAVYTVSGELLQRCAEAAKANGQTLTLHVSETEKEVQDCIEAHGMSPVRWLDHLGVLSDNVIAAHVVHIDEEEAEILKECGVWIAHNPCSNMKLSSGIFAGDMLLKKGCRLTLGTDGTASNNNLDMREEMKFAALLAKVRYTSETLPAGEILRWATRNGAQAAGLDAGVIREGALADAVFLDLENERLVPNFNLTSNWVYSADTRAVRSVLCDGKFVMKDGMVEDAQETIARARQSVKAILSR